MRRRISGHMNMVTYVHVHIHGADMMDHTHQQRQANGSQHGPVSCAYSMCMHVFDAGTTRSSCIMLMWCLHVVCALCMLCVCVVCDSAHRHYSGHTHSTHDTHTSTRTHTRMYLSMFGMLVITCCMFAYAIQQQQHDGVMHINTVEMTTHAAHTSASRDHMPALLSGSDTPITYTSHGQTRTLPVRVHVTAYNQQNPLLGM